MVRRKRSCPANTKQVSEDLSYAIMAACAYSEEKQEQNGCKEHKHLLTESGWTEVQGSRQSLGDTVEVVMYERNGKYVIAFRGTEKNQDDKKFISEDMRNNISTRKKSKEVIERYVKQQMERYGAGNIVFTGHSKGGGEAIIASKITGSDAVVFNHRPECQTVELFEDEQTRGYDVRGDVLSIVRALSWCQSGGNDYIDHLPDINENLEVEGVDLNSEHDMKGVINSMLYCTDINPSPRGGGGGGSW